MGQYLLNSVSLWSEALLLGFAFYFAFVGSRHIAFAVAGAFVAAPYVWLAALRYVNSVTATTLVVGALVAACGAGYQYVALKLLSRGRGAEQLLLISLAMFGMIEAGLALTFGSRAVWIERPSVPRVIARPLGAHLTGDQATVLVVSGLVIVGVLLIWRCSNVGRLARGVLESREGMMLRGFPVAAIEAGLTAVAFSLAGLAGILRLIDGRTVKPSSGLDAGILGVVVFLAGVVIRPSLSGMVVAALLVCVVRLGLQLASPGDWGGGAPLIVLLLVLGTRLLVKGAPRPRD